jgi:DNA polymerase-3 subunit epsilon/ATP-dependent DNA helicase DinG
VAYDTLRATADALQRARDEAELETLIPGTTAETDELVLAQVALAQQGEVMRRVLLAPQEGYVAWLELRAEQAELHEAPVSVAQALRDLVFDRVDTAVLTSATLAVGDNFDFIKQRAGVGDDADELVLQSPFDFFRQALTVLAQAIPPYDDPEHERVIAALIAECAERLGGRILVLFTGYGPLRRVHALVHERLEAQGIAVLGQGIDGTRRQILGSFLADSRTVLLGTNSFWEGIDVPGDALQCVVIDKLPFAVPTDPLVRARSEMLRDPFAQYILPLAVIRLRQGFGRLIRRATDRGAVVLCDDRLGTRRYADAFLQALPPAPLARAAADEIPAMVETFVRHGVAPQAVGESWDA